jgi:hypothetical protein
VGTFIFIFFLSTNVYLLAKTIIISQVESVFEKLIEKFKNEIKNNKKKGN